MIIGSATANIDDNLKKANDANDAAAAANNGVTDINSDNKLTPNEKTSLKRLYDTDVLKHDFDVKQLTSMSLPTTDIDLALSNLTAFTAQYFANMNITETVDRTALNKVFNDFENADKAVEGLFNDAVQQVADDAKTAGEEAKEAGEKAQEAGEEAKASADQAKTDASQAKADAAAAQNKAQDSIDQLNTHLPDIDAALSTANLVKQDVSKLSNTTEQYHNEYTTGIQNVVKTIDDISIGGTNLIKNSKFDDDGTNWRAWGGSEGATVEYNTSGDDWDSRVKKIVKINKPNADDNQFGIAQDKIPVEPGAEYVYHIRSASGNVFLQHGNGADDPWEGVTLNGTNPTYKFKVGEKAQSTNVYLGFDHGQSGTVWISLTKLEKGNKPTDWSLSPFDTATSSEIDQLNNAIKLKADSTDVTSQITVAIQGVQSEVNNKVTDLNTKISQTSDAVQILNTTSGLRNLVYNSSYANSAEGWNMFNKVGYLSTVPASSYNGSPGFGTNISGKGATTWTQFGESKHYTLPQSSVDAANTYSASAMVKMYDDSDSTAKLGATIAFFDKNGTRISGWKDMLINYSQKLVWTEVKFENLPVPSGAQTVAIQFQAYGPKVHGMIAQPMIVFGPKIGPYNSDSVSQSDITASIDNIHLGVKNADGSTSTFNMNGNTILMDTAQTIINGKTSILDASIVTAKIANAAIGTAQIADAAINNAKIANAAINDAKISNLSGNKIIAGTITAKQLNANDIIANVINGKTITGITINTPNLQLGTNGTLTEDWTLNQGTTLFNPKKGSGTMTLSKGILAVSGTISRWWAEDAGYWYGIGDDGAKVKNGSNKIGDNYGAGYVQHNVYDSKGSTILRTYMDATGIYMNGKGTSTVNTLLTQSGLTTTDIYAMGTLGADGAITGASLATSGWVDAGLSAGHGVRIGQQTIQSHNSQNIYFNGDDNKRSVTVHVKAIEQSSQLSRKKDIKPLDPDYAMQVIRESDMYGYRYNEEASSEPLHYSGIIDDINGTPQFRMPSEFISGDGMGRNDGNTVAFLVEALKQADKRIGILEGMMNSD